MDGIRVARKRVLRLMRENALLSPHRARTRDNTPHDRHIITSAFLAEHFHNQIRFWGMTGLM
jgi:hypothetical protein